MPAVFAEDLVMEFRLVHERNMTLKEAAVRLVGGRRSAIERFRALDGVGFEVARGEALGIIGHNGSGKTTLLRLLAGVMVPTTGRIKIEGRITTLIELGAGFNPQLTGEENIYLAGALYGISQHEMRRQFDEIVAFAELERFVHVAVKNYSSGMSARLGFSIATVIDPDVLIVDEVLAVGDEAFQEKCFARMVDFRDRGKTIVLVSHDLPLVERFCDRALLLDHGRLVAQGDPAEVVKSYQTGAAAAGAA